MCRYIITIHWYNDVVCADQCHTGLVGLTRVLLCVHHWVSWAYCSLADMRAGASEYPTAGMAHVRAMQSAVNN